VKRRGSGPGGACEQEGGNLRRINIVGSRVKGKKKDGGKDNSASAVDNSFALKEGVWRVRFAGAEMFARAVPRS